MQSSQNTGLIISQHQAPIDKPLTISENVGGVIENDEVTLLPGGSMTSIVVGADATPEQISQAVDIILDRKKQRKNIHLDHVTAGSLSTTVMSSKASKEDQMAMVKRMRAAFNEPLNTAPHENKPKNGVHSNGPEMRDRLSTVGSGLYLSVSPDAPEEAQVAVAKAAVKHFFPKNKPSHQRLNSSTVSIAQTLSDKNPSYKLSHVTCESLTEVGIGDRLFVSVDENKNNSDATSVEKPMDCTVMPSVSERCSLFISGFEKRQASSMQENAIPLKDGTTPRIRT